jgi:hypothetical protein
MNAAMQIFIKKTFTTALYWITDTVPVVPVVKASFLSSSPYVGYGTVLNKCYVEAINQYMAILVRYVVHMQYACLVRIRISRFYRVSGSGMEPELDLRSGDGFGIRSWKAHK